MKQTTTAAIVATVLTTLAAVYRRLRSGGDDSDTDSEGLLEKVKRGIKWGPIMPWWPRR